MAFSHLSISVLIPKVANDGIRLQHLLVVVVGIDHEGELALAAHLLGLCAEREREGIIPSSSAN